jgi:hypothetical protein
LSRSLAALTITTALVSLTLGCVSSQAIARDFVNAARPSRLPLLVACWEKEFEAADFSGEYEATVSFVVESDTSKIREAKVLTLKASRDTPSRDAAPFQACIEDALNRSALPTVADKDGPGFQTSSDLAVKGYRLLFVDASSAKKRLAAARQAHVLLGPRADRCQGLYTYDPPRDPSTLYNEIASAKSKAFHAREEGGDAYARELQKAYDAMLELHLRMTADVADPMIPKANKKRLQKELDELEASARKTGAEIGCTPPKSSK